MSKTRHLFAPVLLLFCSVALSLLIAELAIRLVRPQARLIISPPGLYEADPPGRYRLRPGYRGRIHNRVEFSNAVRINEAGLRGPGLLPRSSDRLRILTIGDSFPFGVGVDDHSTFIAVLADLLHSESGVDAEALNAGIPGFGVQDAVSWLERHGPALHPDLVVLAVFLGNDLADASPNREGVRIEDGLLVPEKSRGGLKAWLHQHSQLYVSAKSILDRPSFRPLRQRLGLGDPWALRTMREELAVYRKQAPSELSEAVTVVDAALEAYSALADRRGFSKLALLIPGDIQLEPGRWRQALSDVGLDPDDYDADTPTRIFIDLLQSNSIPFVDLTPYLAERIAGGETLYYRHDRHWTPQAHALAARQLLRFLNEAEREARPDGNS